MISGSFLNNRVDIQRNNPAYGNAGQVTNENFTTHTTGAACLIQNLRGLMVDAESNQEYYPTHLIFFRTEEDVQVGDKLVENSNIYMVRRVDQAGGINSHIEVQAYLDEGHR